MNKTDNEYKQWLIDLKKRIRQGQITKCKSVHEAIFYVQKTIKNGWSRAVLMNFPEADLYSAQGKSHRDGILLTVGFNLRTRNTLHSLQSPAGTTLWKDKVPSLRDFAARVTLYLRRLKSTVNKVLSLRDISPLTPHYNFLFLIR